jgi:hypothetical protein
MKGEVAGQEGNFHPTSPGTGMFQTADGYINIAASRRQSLAALLRGGGEQGPRRKP